KKKKLFVPITTHSETIERGKLPYNCIRNVKNVFPSPFSQLSNTTVKDPQYPLEIAMGESYDHFYDTGVYSSEWRFSKYWKTNHPFMGKMSFPQNETKPSRTITATKTANSRESIIYKSEIKRIGDREYRLPTVRE